jgi:hypothetical protein
MLLRRRTVQAADCPIAVGNLSVRDTVRVSRTEIPRFSDSERLPTAADFQKPASDTNRADADL